MSFRPIVINLLFVLSFAQVAASAMEAETDVAPLKNWQAAPFWAPGHPDPTAGTREPDRRAEAVLAIPTTPMPFVAIAPCRVADTRGNGFTGEFGPPSLPAGGLRDITIAGSCGIPASAAAVSANVTVTGTLGPGFIMAYPTGGAVPTVSTLNYVAGQTVANAAILPLGTAGKASFVAGVSGTDLIIDVNGYYASQGIVSSLNGASGILTISQGTNITVATTGSDILISAPGTGGTISGVTAGTGLTGGGTSGTVTVGINVPLGLSSTSASPIVSGTNGGTGNGLQGNSADGAGVVGAHNSSTGNNPGVGGQTNSGVAGAAGVSGNANATSPTGYTNGVLGYNSAMNGQGAGVWGGHAGDGVGVSGNAMGTGNATGVFGQHQAATGNGWGVSGSTNSGAGGGGVMGTANATTPTSFTNGVSGFNAATNSQGAGVTGFHAGDGTGVNGGAAGTGSATGVFGSHNAATGGGPGVKGITNSGDSGANGVQGQANATTPTGFTAGVMGMNNSTNGLGVGVGGNHNGDGFGVNGSAQGTGNATGVYGSHNASTGMGPGVQGVTNSGDSGATGVFGVATVAAPTAWTVGVRGQNNSTNNMGAGVLGNHSGNGPGVNGVAQGTGYATGVIGVHNATTGTGPGVNGQTNSGDAGAIGVVGLAYAVAPTGWTSGVRGQNSATNGQGYGVSGYHFGAGIGVSGSASAGGVGVKGEMTGAGGKGVWGVGASSASAGYFDGPVVVNGDLTVNGTLSKTGGSFRIDHPLEPAEKYLVHSFVESSDMMNIYNGVVTTDSRGFANVTLPDWFEAVNRDFRYQLTVHGDGDTWARARVFRKLEGNAFVVQTDQPAVELSWQVTGIRKDAWAEKNRLPVEEAKTGADRGRYLHPELLGQPEELRIGASHPVPATR
jgi:hypothetical protein